MKKEGLLERDSYDALHILRDIYFPKRGCVITGMLTRSKHMLLTRSGFHHDTTTPEYLDLETIAQRLGLPLKTVQDFFKNEHQYAPPEIVGVFNRENSSERRAPRRTKLEILQARSSNF